jgi:AcrR family transcriptional regulator
MPRRVEPAPPRGRYDRTLPGPARRARQHERLLQATTQALADHGQHATVTHVVAAARIGRNTFYEHFDDFDAAIQEATARGAALLSEQLEQSLTEAWTPRERLRAALGAWTAFVEDQPFVARALLRTPSRQPHSVLTCAGEPLRDLLRALLSDALRDAVVSTRPDELRLAAVTAALEGIARYRLEHPWTHTEDAALASDLVLRVFR